MYSVAVKVSYIRQIILERKFCFWQNLSSVFGVGLYVSGLESYFVSKGSVPTDIANPSRIQTNAVLVSEIR